MPSQIIQGWLNDSSIDINKRTKIFNDLETGIADESLIEGFITQKYGNRYSGVGAVPKVPTREEVGQKAGEVAKGLLGAFTPGKLTQNIAKVAGAAVPGLKRSLVAIGKTVTPEQAARDKVQGAQVELERQAEVQREAQVTQALNKRGLTPSSGATVEEKEELLRQVKGPGQLTVEAAGQGLGEVGKGLADIVSGGSAMVQKGMGALTGIKAPVGAYSPEKGFYQPTDKEAEILGMKGLIRSAGGAMQTVASPLTGIIESAPKEIREPASYVSSLPAQGVEGAAKWILKTMQPDLDVESQEVRERFLDPIRTAFEVGTMAKGPKAFKEEAAAAKALKYSKQAEKYMTEILQPPTKELAVAIQKGKTLPAIREGLKAVKGAKNFDEFVNNFRNIEKHTWETLQEKLAPVAAEPIRLSYLDKLKAEMTELSKSAHNKGKVEAMKEVLEAEMEDWNRAKGFSIGKGEVGEVNTAQARKMQLNKELAPEFVRRDKGATTAFENAAIKAKELIREGLAKEIERIGGKEVGELNMKYGGISDATEMLASQASKFRKVLTPRKIQKLSEKIPILKGLARGKIGEVLTPRVKTMEEMLPGRIGEIKRLTEKAEKVKAPKVAGPASKVIKGLIGTEDISFGRIDKIYKVLKQAEKARTAQEKTAILTNALKALIAEGEAQREK